MSHFGKTNILFAVSLLLCTLLHGCKNHLPEEKNISQSYTLINQSNEQITFPDHFKGKILVTGFIFTNCPDICPMTIHNMQRIQGEIKKAKIDNVEFTAISFDPLRDAPLVLKEQAELREVDLYNFSFLTGKKNVIDSLLDEMNVTAFTGDTTYTESGTPVYFFVHTDRITLVDREGKIRKEYSGSYIDIDEIISDIKYLGE